MIFGVQLRTLKCEGSKITVKVVAIEAQRVPNLTLIW